VHATTGDRIVVDSAIVGHPRPCEVVEVVSGSGEDEHYRAGWDVGTACVDSEQPAEFCSRNDPTAAAQNHTVRACLLAHRTGDMSARQRQQPDAVR